MKLTAKQCDTAKAKAQPYRLADGGGLALHVFPNGGKYWRLRYRVAGKEKTFSIGVHSKQLGLAEARRQRDALKLQIKEGLDPSLEKQHDKAQRLEEQQITFEVVAHEWIAKKSNEWSENHAEDVRRSLEIHVFPAIGNIPISQIRYPLIKNLFERLEKTGALEMVKRTRQRTSGVFRFGIASGYCEADLAEPLKGLISPPKVKNMAAISPDELPAFLHAVNRYNANTITKLAVELMLHTFLRTSELIGKSITENGETIYLGAEWSEIDFTTKLWNIPPERMKVKRAHVVPLSKQAIVILEELQAITGHRQYLFPNHRSPRKPMSNATILRLIERIGYKGKMTGHGFRSIASTILNESGLWRSDVIEMQLAHVPANEIRAAYNRAKYLPERKEMMQWYSDHIDSISGIPIISNSRFANQN